MQTKKQFILIFFSFLTACATTGQITRARENAVVLTRPISPPLSVRSQSAALIVANPEFVLTQFGTDWIVNTDPTGRKGFQLACATRPMCDVYATPEKCVAYDACETVQYYSNVERGRTQLAIFYRENIGRMFNQRWRVHLDGRFLCLDTGKPVNLKSCERVEIVRTPIGRFAGVVIIHSRPGTSTKFARR